jgi:trans-aconitate methyltransferase
MHQQQQLARLVDDLRPGSSVAVDVDAPVADVLLPDVADERASDRRYSNMTKGKGRTTWLLNQCHFVAVITDAYCTIRCVIL